MIWILLCGLAMAEVTVEIPPALGAETVLVVLDDEGRPRTGETVRVVHRPGMAGELEVAIGITDGRGRVRWTPEVPGVAIVRADEETQEFNVERAELPTGTLTLLLLLLLASATSMLYGIAYRPRGQVTR